MVEKNIALSPSGEKNETQKIQQTDQIFRRSFGSLRKSGNWQNTWSKILDDIRRENGDAKKGEPHA